MFSTIQKLKNFGNLVLYHDYRSGTCNDFSGQNNTGVPSSGCTFGRDGIYFNTADYVTVADAVPLRLTTGTIVCLGKFKKQANALRIYNKRDAGGVNIDLYYSDSPDRLSLYSTGGAVAVSALSMHNKKYLAVDFATGTISKVYVDGLYSCSFLGASTITADDANLTIGGYYTGTNGLQNWMSAILLINRVLTQSEHASLYAELDAIKYEKSI